MMKSSVAPNVISRMFKLKRQSFGRASTVELLVMCVPAVLLLFFLSYLPMFGLIVAFKRYRVSEGVLGSAWVGLKNFEYMFATPDAWRITRNTVGMNLIFIIVGVIVPLALALMFNEMKNRKAIKVFQTSMFFPYFVSWVVAGYMLYAFLSMDKGIVNMLLERFGTNPVEWYSKPGYWPFILTLAVIWKWTGYTTIIYYACLMNVDSALYEAAEIDGASHLQMVRYISLPQLSPMITILVLLQVGRIFYSDFGMFYNLPMQVGMLYETTDVIDTYVLRAFKKTNEIGMATAAGFYQSIVGFIMVVASNLVVKRFNPDYALF